MDFQRLNRRELQALCKLNKIPANITNVAMAEALSSLDFVQGIEDFMKPAQSDQTGESCIESPVKVEVTSPKAPRTSCRTSTRLREKKEVAECLPTVMRTTTRRGARSQISVDVQETSAVSSSRRRAAAIATSACRSVEKQLDECVNDLKSEKKSVLDTPVAVPNSRRRGPAAASVVKTVEQKTNARRSVRLTEKKSAKAIKTEGKPTEALKIDLLLSSEFNGKLKLDSDASIEVSEDTSLSGTSSLKVSEESISIHDSEVSSEGTKDDVRKEIIVHSELENSEAKSEDNLNIEAENVPPVKVGENVVPPVDGESVIPSIEFAENVVLPAETAENDVPPSETAENDVPPAETAENDVPPAVMAENVVPPAETAENVVPPVGVAENVVPPVGDAENVVPSELSEVSNVVHSEFIKSETKSDYLEGEVDLEGNSHHEEGKADLCKAENMKAQTEEHLVASENGDDNVSLPDENLTDFPESENEEVFSAVKNGSEDTIAAELRIQLPENKTDTSLSAIESPNEQDSTIGVEGLTAAVSSGSAPNDNVKFSVTFHSMAPEETHQFDIEEDIVSEDLTSIFAFEAPVQLGEESSIDYVKNGVAAIEDHLSLESSDEVLLADHVNPNFGEDDADDKITAIDANTIEDVICQEQLKGEKEFSTPMDFADQFADAAADILTAETELYSRNSINQESGLLLLDTLAAEKGDAFSLMMAKNGADQRADMTTSKKASTKTPTTARRSALISDDKENIDRCGIKLQLTAITKDEGTKNTKAKAEADRLAILKETSLRQLRKQLKNLSIKDSLNTAKEETNKVEKTPRPALQVLPVNRLATGETKS